MDFQSDTAFQHRITAYGPGWIEVDGERQNSSLLLSSKTGILSWPYPRFDTLDEQAFSQLLQYRPQIIVFGSGSQLRFPRPTWIKALIQQQIGVETMDLYAACRTYNILASEGRNTIFAALIESPDTP
ncbi:hypothetical protein CUZ56_00509 [Saezia sanguinis]|jgi:uncharacterized protein|uniref:Mth938-like domain-containing protein n=1 Tax=Saezia sanguinis TaxID=1965230 RepID=A0A433SH45_9BURK|nr:Mth938-like domain-containing protein [Saezia sanguinis]RUS68026.1 hypothetical protein CUZ56_00509 [Saezia sanguinis]